MPKLSVYIIAFNEEHKIENALNYWVRQRFLHCGVIRNWGPAFFAQLFSIQILFLPLFFEQLLSQQVSPGD